MFAASALISTQLAVSTVELTIRMGVALVLITTFLVAATRFTKRHMQNRGGERPQIDIRHQRQLSKQATVTLLTAGERNLLIAHTNSSTTLLAEGDDLVVTPSPSGKGSGQTAAGKANTDETSIDIRSKSKTNPIRSLQNRTVRRG